MFTPEDDEELTNHVLTVGDSNWSYISQHMKRGFTARQCRERWHNYLDPRLGHESWTETEDRKLIDEFQRLGNQWATIAELFPGRSGNAIRNRFLLLQRKQRKQSIPPRISFCVPKVGPNEVPLISPNEGTEKCEKSGGFSLFNPENFTDVAQDSIVSMFFPPN
jgi:hypothetical protein